MFNVFPQEREIIIPISFIHGEKLYSHVLALLKCQERKNAKPGTRAHLWKNYEIFEGNLYLFSVES